MKRLVCLILLNITIAAAQDAPPEVFRVPDFSRGVITRYNPTLIPDNALQWGVNIYVDEQGITRRKGYSQFNSEVFTNEKSVRGLWGFIADDGSRYILALSSQTVYKAPTTGVFEAIDGLSGFSTAVDMDAVPYLGKIWFTNGVDSMAYWDGASTKTVTEGPLGSLIEGWRNRLVTAGVSGSLSYIYMSKELDGEEWTTGPTTSVDPVAIAVGGTNAKPIKCMYGGYKDFLFVATEDEVFGVYGFGRNDFVLRTISKEVGCIEDKSVQEKDGALYWLSRRGVEKMTGQYTTERISDNVRDVFDTLIGNTGVARNKIYTTQDHWEAGSLVVSGTMSAISATISPGSLVPSTWTRIDTSSTNFTDGTLSNISSTHTIGSIELLIRKSTGVYDDFTDAQLTTNPTWTSSEAVNHFSATTGQLVYTNTTSGTEYNTLYASNEFVSFNSTMTYNSYMYASVSGNNVAVSQLTHEVFFMASSSSTDNMDAYSLSVYVSASKTIVGPLYVLTCSNPMAYLYKYTNGTRTTLDSQSLTAAGAGISGTACILSMGNVTFSVSSDGDVAVTSDGTVALNLSGTTDVLTLSSQTVIRNTSYMNGTGVSAYSKTDTIWISSNGYLSSGTFTSAIFDTTFSTPIGGPFSFTETVPVSSTLAYSVRESSWNSADGMGAWTLVNTTTSGDFRIPLTNRFWQYKAYFTTDYSTNTPSIQDVTLTAATTGEYIHDCAVTDTINAWGNFQANSVLDGGSIAYYVSTGASCDSVERATAAWTAQNNNAPIIVDTAAYIGVKEIFTISASTNTALLRDVTINWLEGTNRPNVASAVYRERYYLAYTTSTDSGKNDFMFVSDKNDAITFLENMNCYSMVLFNRRLYCGDANSTGKIYQLEIGEDDDGASFVSEARTKAYSFGDSDAEKEFVKMYATLVPESDSALNVNITPLYHLDLSTTAITLEPINTGEDSTAGILVSKIPFAMSNNISGRYIDVEFQASGTSQPFTLFGLNFYLRKYPVK